jgi:hypothetical protein
MSWGTLLNRQNGSSGFALFVGIYLYEVVSPLCIVDICMLGLRAYYYA